jgi:HSP20 family protein
MTLVRCQPYHSPLMGMVAMKRMMDRFFNESPADDAVGSVWSPRIEVVETDSNFEVTAELPGIEKDDVKIELQDNILTLSGEKKSVEEKREPNLHFCERAYGKFARSFQLPALVNSGGIKASFKNGVLTLNLPKDEEAKPRQIEIKAE